MEPVVAMVLVADVMEAAADNAVASARNRTAHRAKRPSVTRTHRTSVVHPAPVPKLAR